MARRVGWRREEEAVLKSSHDIVRYKIIEMMKTYHYTTTNNNVHVLLNKEGNTNPLEVEGGVQPLPLFFLLELNSSSATFCNDRKVC